MPDDSKLETIPVGSLGIVAHKSCTGLGEKVDHYLVKWRANRDNVHKDNIVFHGYEADTYLISADCPRFGSGEAKGVLNESVRGKDIYIMVDVGNYSCTYMMAGQPQRMSPDDHYADLKRLIAAMTDKPKKITVIMPFLYESRQHKRSSRESLDCAVMLQELKSYGVDNIVTFDAHDPRVVNAIPKSGFENVRPTYQFIKTLLRTTPDLEIDNNHMMVISPDEGAMHRAIYFANLLGVDVGMFYKRRDFSRVVDGRNPIVAHEFLGSSVEGKDVIILDDMISSGESMLDVTRQLKDRGAERVFVCTTFGLFTEGLDKFDEYYEKGYLDRLITTNLTYLPPQLHDKPYFIEADMSKFLALIIDSMNHSTSISAVMNPTDKIHDLLAKRNMR